MNDNVYSFEDYRPGIKFTLNNGFKQVTPQMIGDAYTFIRGDCNCSFLITKISTDGLKEIQRGYLDREDLDKVEVRKQIAESQNILSRILESNLEPALDVVKSEPDFFITHEENAAAIYALCDDGLMGAAWYGDTIMKNYMMSAFLLYALGFINPDVDPIFWTSTYKYLLYESGLGDPMDFDEVILEALRKSINSNGYTTDK